MSVLSVTPPATLTAPQSMPQSMPSLRVLMVAPTSFFADYGCHVRIAEEARALERLGHEVTIATYANGKELPGVRTVRTMPIPWRQHYEVGSSRHKILFDVLLGGAHGAPTCPARL